MKNFHHFDENNLKIHAHLPIDVHPLIGLIRWSPVCDHLSLLFLNRTLVIFF